MYLAEQDGRIMVQRADGLKGKRSGTFQMSPTNNTVGAHTGESVLCLADFHDCLAACGKD